MITQESPVQAASRRSPGGSGRSGRPVRAARRWRRRTAAPAGFRRAAATRAGGDGPRRRSRRRSNRLSERSARPRSRRCAAGRSVEEPQVDRNVEVVAPDLPNGGESSPEGSLITWGSKRIGSPPGAPPGRVVDVEILPHGLARRMIRARRTCRAGAPGLATLTPVHSATESPPPSGASWGAGKGESIDRVLRTIRSP